MNLSFPIRLLCVYKYAYMLQMHFYLENTHTHMYMCSLFRWICCHVLTVLSYEYDLGERDYFLAHALCRLLTFHV